jgi:histidinol dehydrogenase (EC 1.1.1.23)
MPIRLDSQARDFAKQFDAFLATKREAAVDVESAVRDIIADVIDRGDTALLS